MEEQLNFAQVWKMFQETDKKFQETDKKFQETDKKFQKDREESFKQLKEMIKETNKAINGIGKSNGEIAEDFFYNGLESNMKIGNINIDYIDRNLERKSKKLNLKGEYDILLSNDNLVVIVEVKYKVRCEDIEELLNKKILNFRKLFPRYSNFNIQGAIAGFTFEKKAIELGKKYGFYIIIQSGENLKYLNPVGRMTNRVYEKKLILY